MQNYKRGHFVRARSFKSPFLQCRQHGRVKFTFTDGSGNLDLLFLVARMALLALALLLPCRKTDIACFAAFPRHFFSKMVADDFVAAFFRFGEAANFVIAIPRTLLLSVIRNLFDEVREQSCILFLPQDRKSTR